MHAELQKMAKWLCLLSGMNMLLGGKKYFSNINETEYTYNISSKVLQNFIYSWYVLGGTSQEHTF